jgi:hypothetical protein
MKTTARKAWSYEDLLRLVAFLSLGAGVVHFIVSPEYLSEWWGYGFFFIFAGLAQITYGLLLFLLPWLQEDTASFYKGTLPGIRPIYLAGVCGNAAIAVLYFVTRTVGIPTGPQAGAIEPVTIVGLITTLAELTMIGVLVVLARRSDALARSTA